ncbi:MAG: DUF5406 domain-containing protein [Proteobacteria bacterium]|nr:DUF5406 domain-containing protein [Pseudomonadota bacterium]
MSDVFNADPNQQRVDGKLFRLTFGCWQYRWTVETTVFGNCSGFDNLSCAIGNIAEDLPGGGWGARVVMTDAAGDELECDTEDDDVEEWLNKHLISAEIIGFVDRRKEAA